MCTITMKWKEVLHMVATVSDIAHQKLVLTKQEVNKQYYHLLKIAVNESNPAISAYICNICFNQTGSDMILSLNVAESKLQ